MSEGELILYRSPDGLTEIQLRAIDGTVWLAQAEIAELFQTSKQSVSYHVKQILDDGELTEGATVKEILTVQTEGGRDVRRSLKLYSLEMILAIGYRVRSPRGTQFRQWATTALKEYLVKGFVINDVRLKEPGGFDYFDELLERIRDIRASEKRFYQKVRDVFAAAHAPLHAADERVLKEDREPRALARVVFLLLQFRAHPSDARRVARHGRRRHRAPLVHGGINCYG